MKTQKGKYTIAMPTCILIKNVFEKNIIPNFATIKIPNTSPASNSHNKKRPNYILHFNTAIPRLTSDPANEFFG
jgi:hypothetical protein